MKKLLLYTYRIALVLCILIGVVQLFSKALNWFLYLYPPYTGFSLIALVAVLCIFIIVLEHRIGKGTQPSNHAVLSDDEPPPDFWQETEEIVERCLSRYPYEVEKSDDGYIIWMNNRTYYIYIVPGNLWIKAEFLLSGWTDIYYEEDTLEELEATFLTDMEELFHDRQVQVGFVIDERTLRDSFFCPPNELDTRIQQELAVYTKKPPLWSRFLRLFFLVPPKKPIKEIRIASASGKYDRVIPL